MRTAMRDTMDDDVRVTAKRSIQAPQGIWLRTEPMRSYIHDIIHSDSFADRGVFDVAKVHTAFEHFCEGANDNSFFVWQWINTEEWFRVFIDGNALDDRYPVCPEIQASAAPNEIVSSQEILLSSCTPK